MAFPSNLDLEMDLPSARSIFLSASGKLQLPLSLSPTAIPLALNPAPFVHAGDVRVAVSWVWFNCWPSPAWLDMCFRAFDLGASSWSFWMVPESLPKGDAGRESCNLCVRNGERRLAARFLRGLVLAIRPHRLDFSGQPWRASGLARPRSVGHPPTLGGGAGSLEGGGGLAVGGSANGDI